MEEHSYIVSYIVRSSNIYIYIYRYIYIVSVGLSVCLYHHSGQTGRWISLKLGMMIGSDPT